jgi:hypothetical protein
MLASFLSVLPILTPPLCALAFDLENHKKVRLNVCPSFAEGVDLEPYRREDEDTK